MEGMGQQLSKLLSKLARKHGRCLRAVYQFDCAVLGCWTNDNKIIIDNVELTGER